MGLNRTVTLSIKGFDYDNNDHVDIVNNIAEKANEIFDVGFEYDRPPTATGINWYDIHDDMKKLSQLFPDLVLVIEVEEGSGERWTSYFHNGEMATPLDGYIIYPEAADKVIWDKVEIHPVWAREDGACDVCESGKESMWSVYLHQVSGGVVCIADAPTEKEAEKLAKLIETAGPLWAPIADSLP